MNVLILEDDLERIEFFKIHFPDADYTDITSEAIELLKSKKYDRVYLDHDLHWEHYTKDTDNKFCGNFVASFLRDNPEISIGKIYIHSLNYNGVARMVENLKDRNIRVVPFLIGRTEDWAKNWLKNFNFSLTVKRRDTDKFSYFYGGGTSPDSVITVEIDDGLITAQERLI